MKENRHQKIIEIIENNSVSTQDELQQLLKEAGYDVNQATISRDIRELHLSKKAESNGIYRYIRMDTAVDSKRKYYIILSEAVISVAQAQNIVVIKCHTGMANAACAALDSIAIPGSVGTIAGDDTMIIIFSDNDAAFVAVSEIKKILKASR